MASPTTRKDDLPHIRHIVHIHNKPRESEALDMLNRIALLVKPIMIRRGYTIGYLTEFCPQEEADRDLAGRLLFGSHPRNALQG